MVMANPAAAAATSGSGSASSSRTVIAIGRGPVLRSLRLQPNRTVPATRPIWPGRDQAIQMDYGAVGLACDPMGADAVASCRGLVTMGSTRATAAMIPIVVKATV